jgi:drug/metabolite transporter (DMT)-like permease
MLEDRFLTARARGILLVGGGVLLLSPDSLFIRLMTMDQWTLLFFRGACALVGFLVLLRLGGHRAMQRATWAIGRSGLAVSCLIVVGNVLFVISIRHTNAALALVILASAPMFTAVISRVFTSEPVPRRTWIAAGIVLGGIGAIFLTKPQGGEVGGALAALGASLSVATLLVVVRASGNVSMLPSQAVGALLTAAVMIPFCDPGSVSGTDLLIALPYGLLILPLALALIIRGPRYLLAPEVSLLTLIETVVGPAWIWFALGDPPTLQAALAGALIVGTLATHAVLAQRVLTRQPASA